MTLAHAALNHAAHQGIGSTVATGVAQHLYDLAQQVRAYTMHVSTDISAQKNACAQAATSIAASQTVSWQSSASEAYDQVVRAHLGTNQEVRGQLAHAATQTVLAGENIAVRLEDLAASVAAAGATVDAVIGHVASNEAIETL